jgi:sirohydrochlorin cobaltochelatase
MLVLIGHGSRDPEGNEAFQAFARVVGKRWGRPYEVGFIDHAEPTMDQALERAAGREEPLTVMPVILFAAGHVKQDVPRAIGRLRRKFPDVLVRCAPHVGLHERMVDILEDRMASQVGDITEKSRKGTAVLLMGRGSSDPDANGDCLKLGRLLWERVRFPIVEVCFIGITQPSLPEGLDRCVRLGARRILVIPYLLFTGILHKRVAGVLERFRWARPGIEVSETSEIGLDERLIQAVAERIAEAEESLVRGATA